MKITMVFLFFLQISCTKFQVENENHTINICVQNIIAKYFKNDMLIYWVDCTNFSLTYPIVLLNSLSRNKVNFKTQLPDFYVIQLENKNITKVLKNFRKHHLLNSRAKFIILTQFFQNVNGLFSDLSKFYIYQAIVIDEEAQAATYDPYTYEDVMATDVELKFFENCENAEFRGHLPKLWRNTTVNTLDFVNAPFLYWDVSGKRKHFGSVIFDFFKEQIKFRSTFKETSNYTELFDQLETRAIDVVLKLETLRPEQVHIYDPLSLHIRATVQWVVPKAKLMPVWKAFSLTYSTTVWVIIFLSFLSISTLWYFIEQRDFSHSLQFFYQILLEVSTSCTKRVLAVPSRVLFFSSTISFFIISTELKTVMIRMFSNPPYEHQINSMKDISDAKLSCIVLDGYVNIFKNEYVRNECTLLSHGVRMNELLKSISHDANLSMMFSNLAYKSIMYNYHLKGEQLRTYLIPEVITFNYYYLLFMKDYPLHSRIFEITGRLINGGIIQYLLKRNFDRIDNVLQGQRTFSNILTFEHISVAFYILISGLIVSTAVFLIEFFFGQYNKQ